MIPRLLPVSFSPFRASFCPCRSPNPQPPTLILPPKHRTLNPMEVINQQSRRPFHAESSPHQQSAPSASPSAGVIFTTRVGEPANPIRAGSAPISAGPPHGIPASARRCSRAASAISDWQFPSRLRHHRRQPYSAPPHTPLHEPLNRNLVHWRDELLRVRYVRLYAAIDPRIVALLEHLREPPRVQHSPDNNSPSPRLPVSLSPLRVSPASHSPIPRVRLSPPSASSPTCASSPQ